MSLAVVIKGTEGVVLAADSRVTLQAQKPGIPLMSINYDNATKLLSFSKPHTNVGVVTYGLAVIGQRTAHSFVPEFEVALKDQLEQEGKEGKEGKENQQREVLDFAKRLSHFFMERWKDEGMPDEWKGPNMAFIVGGFDPGAAYGKVFLFEIPGRPVPEPRNEGDKQFGMTWGGQLQIASRIIRGFDPGVPETLRKTLNLSQEQMDEVTKAFSREFEFPIPFIILPLQDCVDLATFLIRSTMIAQSLAIGLRGVGGPIDVSVVTRTDGLRAIQEKTIHGEASNPKGGVG